MVNLRGGNAVAEATAGPTTSPQPGTKESRAARSGARTSGLRSVPPLYLVVVGLLTLAGFFLRWPSFKDSLLGDEISTYYIVNGHSFGRVMSLIYSGQESTPPLYFILAWVTKGWFGTAHIAQGIRLVPMLAGTAAIPLTFVLGLMTVGRRAALVGATCVACSPFMIFYSTDARTYMLVLFLGLCSTICLMRAIATSRFAWWAGYAVSSCAAMYSHYSVIFFLVAQFAWAFFASPRSRKALVWSNVAAGVAFLPGLAGLPAADRAQNYFSFLMPVTLHNVQSLAENFWIGQGGFNLHVVPGDLAVALGAFGLALGAFGTVLVRWHQKSRRWRVAPPVLLIATLVVAPFVIMIAYSWVRTDVLSPENIIASWPALALAIGALVTLPQRPLRFAAVALVVAAYGIGAWQMQRTQNQRGNIGGAVAYIERTGQNGDPIVNLPAFANPLSELDAALFATPSYTYVPGNTIDRARSPIGDPHPVIRLQAPIAAPPLNEPFKLLAAPRPSGGRFGFPVPTPEQVAQQAMSEARNGTVFFVTPWSVDVKEWVAGDPNSAMGRFLRTMLTQYHVARQVRFPSQTVWGDAVYVQLFRKNS